MSTSDLPLSGSEQTALSEAQLSALASQIYATSLRPGPDSPPVTTQVAPRGVAPDATTGTSAAATASAARNIAGVRRRVCVL